MNLEQRQKRKDLIRKLDGLIAYANQTGDTVEAVRLRMAFVALGEDCGDGCCCG